MPMLIIFRNKVSQIIMRRIIIFCCAILLTTKLMAQDERSRSFPKEISHPKRIPPKSNVWIFILAGQSNMAGRGIVAPSDTIPNDRILTINARNEIIIAKEPLHFYEPDLTGLDCGMSFANQLITNIERPVTILLVPTAVGGSSSSQWVGDSLHRNVKLMTNFKDRVNAVKKYGTIKGILWHQGESDTRPTLIAGYQKRLQQIFSQFRSHVGDPALPIIMGELGSYSENQANWNLINEAIHQYAAGDKHAFVVDTEDLRCKEDKIHFDSDGQREMGARMAKKFLETSNK